MLPEVGPAIGVSDEILGRPCIRMGTASERRYAESASRSGSGGRSAPLGSGRAACHRCSAYPGVGRPLHCCRLDDTSSGTNVLCTRAPKRTLSFWIQWRATGDAARAPKPIRQLDRGFQCGMGVGERHSWLSNATESPVRREASKGR